MAIPRSRKKLTYVLNNVDTRIRHLEMRPKGSYANVGAVQALIDNSIIDLIDGTISNIGPNAPSSYKMVTQARYIPYNLAGGKDRVEIYTDVDSGAVANSKMLLYGLHGTDVYSSGLEVGGAQTVIDVGRISNARGAGTDAAPSGTYVFSYSPGYRIWSPYEFNIHSQNTISKYSATTTTGTLTISTGETNQFVVGDVIYVNNITSDFNGPQVVTETTDTTVKFDFRTSLANPIAESTAPSGALATAVVHEYVNTGDTWIDTSVTPNVVYVWNGSAWTNLASTTITADKVKPAPPTDVSATAAGVYDSAGIAKAKITVTWTAPTLNADGTPLKDLAGYTIYYRQAENQEYYQQSGGPETTQLIVPMFDTKTAFDLYIAVKARDSGGNLSEFSPVYVLHVDRPATPLIAPSAPLLTSRLGTVTVSWDGKNFLGGPNPDSLDHIEVHRSTSQSFALDMDTTYIGSISSGAGGYVVASNLTYNTTYYFKFVSVDKTGVKTTAGAEQSIAVTPLVNTDIIGKIIDGAKIVAGSVTASDAIIGNTITGNLIRANAIEAGNINANAITSDKIEVGALDGKVITGAQIQTARPVGESGGKNNRVVLNQYGLYAYNTSGVETFKILANTGAVTIGAGATNPDLTGVATIANNAYSQANTANDNAGYANTNVNDVKANIYTPTQTTIDGGKITAGSITANAINLIDTFRYDNPIISGGTNTMYMGRGAIPDWDDSMGISFTYTGTRSGWVGSWTPGVLEIGNDFYENFLDFGLGGTNTTTLRSGSGIDFRGGNFIVNNSRLTVQAPHRQYYDGVALLISATDTGVRRMLQVDTTTASQLVAVGYSGIGTTHESLRVYGTVTSNGTVLTSARRFKKDLKVLAPDMNVLNLNTYSFRYDYDEMYKNEKDSITGLSEPTIGVIAEELEDLGYKELVSYDKDGNTSGVEYSKLAVLLLPIVKQLRADVDELSKKVDKQ